MKLERIWVVTGPRPKATRADVCFSCTPLELERQFRGGLSVQGDAVEFYTNEAEAQSRANHILNLCEHFKEQT